MLRIYVCTSNYEQNMDIHVMGTTRNYQKVRRLMR